MRKFDCSAVRGLAAVLVILMMAFTSCHVAEPPIDYPDDPYRTGLIGVWDFAFDEIGPITNPRDIDSFQFDPDGTGFYAYEDEYGQWINMPFRWRSFYGDFLEIFYLTGEYKSTNYYFYNGYLCFGDQYSYAGYALRY